MTDDSQRKVRAAESDALRAALRGFATRSKWLASPGGATLAERLARHLAEVHLAPAASPRPDAVPPDMIRAVHWNLLHGCAYDAIARAFEHDSRLGGADLVSLNEVDVGLARSGNRHVAFDLAARHGWHAAWTALFLELEGGRGLPGAAAATAAAAAPGDAESLFGLALLSRWPLEAVRRIELPSPEALLFDRERKAGGFVALQARVQHPHRPFTAVVTHLDVHGSPHSRLGQMRALLDAIDSGPAVLLGDLNTTTFARGSVLRSARTLSVLALAPRWWLHQRSLAPFEPRGSPREPLLTALRDAGFAFEPYNDGLESALLQFGEVHELHSFPVPLRAPLLRALRWVERRNVLRLDWIAARGFRAEGANPFTRSELLRANEPPSDHAPIGCDLRF